VPIQVVVEKHLTEARFLKSVQHLNERGLITNEKRDLKDLVPEFYSDLIDECNDDITTIVMSHFYSDLRRRCANFTVQSYINHLTEKQFEE
jgi:predicted transcriptional regulator